MDESGDNDEQAEDVPTSDLGGDEVSPRAAAYARLMLAEERVYQLWERRSGGEVDWVGDLVGFPVEAQTPLWLAALADKVAALGGYVEVVAVLPDESVTLLIEPGLGTAQVPDE